MGVSLKKLSDQTIVLTGASSGIGLATARLAAQKGARLVLAARSADALSALVTELTAGGGRAVPVVADVASPDDVREIARVAHAEFGGFDTWVNNAGVSIYGTIEEVPIEDMRRVMETNFWGVVYGSKVALPVLKDRGGALINLGSTVSDRALPLQGIYSASKHAIKGFTDALRMELEDAGAPVSVSLIKPGPIDTPFPLNAKNYLETEPKHVPKVYAPEVVAQAILHCAEHPTRDVFVGGSGKGQSVLGYRAPRLADKLMERLVIPGTKSDEPAGPLDDNALDRPSERLTERGNYPGHVFKTSLYTTSALHPAVTRGALVGAGVAVAAWRAVRNGNGNGNGRG